MNETALMIRGVRLDDAGRYECTALNIFGRDAESLLLAVTGNMGTFHQTIFLLNYRNNEAVWTPCTA